MHINVLAAFLYWTQLSESFIPLCLVKKCRVMRREPVPHSYCSYSPSYLLAKKVKKRSNGVIDWFDDDLGNIPVIDNSETDEEVAPLKPSGGRRRSERRTAARASSSESSLSSPTSRKSSNTTRRTSKDTLSKFARARRPPLSQEEMDLLNPEIKFDLNGWEEAKNSDSFQLNWDDIDDDGNYIGEEAIIIDDFDPKKVTIRSPTLKKLSEAEISRTPRSSDYQRVWIAAVDAPLIEYMTSTFGNYGIEFAANIGDVRCYDSENSVIDTDADNYEDNDRAYDAENDDYWGQGSIEEIARAKARAVFAATGLPVIADRTSFQVMPVNAEETRGLAKNTAKYKLNTCYYFDDIGPHVVEITEILKGLSEVDRGTEFETCLCYYDGEIELFTHGCCEADLIFSDISNAFVSFSHASQLMSEQLSFLLDLKYKEWRNAHVEEKLRGRGSGSVNLAKAVLKDGKVLQNDIVDLSSFMDSFVDVNLMDECALELSKIFESARPITKVLTVATTGLVLGLPLAKYLQVPLVYARKSRSATMSECYTAGSLLVSKSHLTSSDRVLVVDDFLSSGDIQETLLRIVSESGATCVGIGILVEKVFKNARKSLSGYDLRIESLCKIESVKDGIIVLAEEEV